LNADFIASLPDAAQTAAICYLFCTLLKNERLACREMDQAAKTYHIHLRREAGSAPRAIEQNPIEKEFLQAASARDDYLRRSHVAVRHLT
jgi:hypothetical protein